MSLHLPAADLVAATNADGLDVTLTHKRNGALVIWHSTLDLDLAAKQEALAALSVRLGGISATTLGRWWDASVTPCQHVEVAS